MKSKLKLWLFSFMIVVGLILCVLEFYFWNSLAMRILGIISPSLIFIGAIFFAKEYKKIKHPKEYERDIIEQNDERNVFMRYKAGYRSGQILAGMCLVLILLEYCGYVDLKSWTFLSAAMLWIVLQTILYAVYKNL